LKLSAATLTVCASGCQYSTIQGAIDHAANNDVISIEKGHYFETVNTKGKGLTLQGVNSRQAIIDGNGPVARVLVAVFPRTRPGSATLCSPGTRPRKTAAAWLYPARARSPTPYSRTARLERIAEASPPPLDSAEEESSR